MKSTIDKLKAISRAFNSSDSIEQFAINLDLSLANISVDEAERLYADQCRDIIKHMSPFWCENRKFSFRKAFMHFDSYYKQYNALTVKKFALPYKMQKMFDKDRGLIIAMYAISPNGKDLVQTMSADLAEYMQAMDGIKFLHESIMIMIYEISKEIMHGC